MGLLRAIHFDCVCISGRLNETCATHASSAVEAATTLNITAWYATNTHLYIIHQFTYVYYKCLCFSGQPLHGVHKTVQFRTSYGAVMPYGWKGNRRSGVALVGHVSQT